MTKPIVKTGREAKKEEREKFVNLVKLGGQVDPIRLPVLVEDALHLSFAYEDGELIATGAVKGNPGYQAKIANKSGIPLPPSEYLGEVGYLHTAELHRKKGHGKAVMASLFEAAGGKGLFATVQAKNDKSQRLLELSGFVRVGKPWKSKEADDDVHLYIRPPTGKAQ